MSDKPFEFSFTNRYGWRGKIMCWGGFNYFRSLVREQMRDGSFLKRWQLEGILK